MEIEYNELDFLVDVLKNPLNGKRWDFEHGYPKYVKITFEEWLDRKSKE